MSYLPTKAPVTPKLGETVIYTATEDFARRVNADRIQYKLRGNKVWRGDQFAAVVVRVFDCNADARANLQILLDGEDAEWETSVPYQSVPEPGFWSLP
jgi:hypothetical protein